MLIEWDAHNDIFWWRRNERCQHVDIDNEDQGTEYCGVKVTRSGLLAARHLVGIGNMRKGLYNQMVVRDGNGVPASEYMAIFSGYNVSWVW